MPPYSAVISPDSPAALSRSIPLDTIVPNARARPAMSDARSSSQSRATAVSSLALSSAATIRPKWGDGGKQKLPIAFPLGGPLGVHEQTGIDAAACKHILPGQLEQLHQRRRWFRPQAFRFEHELPAARCAAPIARFNQRGSARHVAPGLGVAASTVGSSPVNRQPHQVAARPARFVGKRGQDFSRQSPRKLGGLQRPNAAPGRFRRHAPSQMDYARRRCPLVGVGHVRPR